MKTPIVRVKGRGIFLAIRLDAPEDWEILVEALNIAEKRKGEQGE